MANNRMYLVHKETGTAILLAKYYPTSGWYVYHPVEGYDTFFEEFDNESLFGDNDFELRYEIGKPELNGTEKFPYNHGGRDEGDKERTV